MKFQVSYAFAAQLCICSPAAEAGGPFTNGVSARAQSMQNAFIAIADDASAVYYNPAGLANVRSPTVDVSAFGIFPKLEYFPPGAVQVERSSASAAGVAAFASAPLREGFVAGLGFYAPVARATKFGEAGAFSGTEHRSEILRKDLTVSAGADFGPINVGASVVLSHITYRSSVLGFSEKGSGNAASYQLGVLGDSPFRWAAVYRSPVTLDVSGSGTLTNVGAGTFIAKQRLPSSLTVGTAFELLDKRVKVAIEIERQFWSKIREFAREYEHPSLSAAGSTRLSTRDSSIFRVGGLYRPTSISEVRTGYSWTQAAIGVSSIIPAQPDFTIRAYSMGYTRSLNEFLLHVGLERQNMLSRKKVDPPFPGEYSMRVNTLSFGLSRAW